MNRPGLACASPTSCCLGISLLFWYILLQVSLLPVYMWALAGRIVPIDLGAILQSVVLFLARPYALAFATRRLLAAGGRDAAALPGLGLGLGKTGALMVVIAAMFASQGEVLLQNPGLVWRMVAPGAVFFAFAFALALLLGRLARLSYRELALLTFTTTARNSEVSLALAATAFASPLVALTVVIGPAIELPVLILILRALRGIRSRGWYS